MIHRLSPKRALVAASAATAALAVLVLVLPGVPAAAAHSAHAPVKAVAGTKQSAGSSTILVGSVTGTSGAYASTGVATLDGALLAVTDLNHHGGALGKKFTLQSYDDAASPTLAAKLFKRLVKSGAVAVLGSADSGNATAATADELHVPDLGVVADAATTALPWVWNSGPDASAVGATDAAYALKDCKSLALVHGNSTYGDSGEAAIKLAYTAAHKPLALDEAVSEDLSTGATVSFTKNIKQIVASKASCVVAWLTPQDTASLAQTLKSKHVHVTLIGNDAVAANETFSLLSGTAGSGTMAPELAAQLHPSSALQAFAKSYQAKFHMAATAGAISSYDAVLMLAAAIKHEHSTSPTKLQTAFNSLTGSAELQGTVTFSNTDHTAVTSRDLMLASYDAAAKTWKTSA